MDILRGVYTLTKISQVTVTAPIFRLHCNATVVLLLTFSIAVTTREYVGNPIDCVYSNRVSGSIPEDTLNTYCWIHSTYTVTDALGKIPGRQVAYPGVINSEGDPAAVKHVKYYQWVAFVLFFQLSKHTLDGSIFKLHIFTCGLLLAFALILVTSQLCGANIHCDNNRINQNVLDSFCWIHGTYSVVHGYNKTVGRQVPYPGVMPTFGNDEELRHHKYYQWTVTIIMAQAILFYTPRWLWKSWEGGKIHALMMDLDIGICTDIEKKQKKKLMIDYLWENLRFHNWWAYKYYFCELLALVNVIGQMFLMNRFFDGAFLTFGIEVIQFMDNDEEDRVDPMIKIFPRMTKCTFYKYGVSGEIEKHDAICILPLNVVNEKIYVFLWFWFIILTCLTFLTVVYRIIIIFSPRMRVYLLRMRYRLVRKDAIDLIVRRSKMGDWFLFYMLGENVDSVIFRDVLQELANKLGSNPSHHMSGPRGDMMDA